ncbi:MAG: hypothetical protein K1X71_12585 [Pirellulales bacterium]|nr:hypothetical protein [Pirellulales bacterium]
MTTAVFFALTLVGVDAGWQPLSGGGYEYIIQIEPASIAALQAGQAIVSDVPAALGDIRSYRIQVGVGALPRETAPPDSQPKSPPADDPPVVTPAPGSDHAAQLAGVAIADEPPPASANNPAPDESPTRRVAGFRPENTAPSSDTPSAAVDTSTTPAPAASTFVVQASHWVKNLADRRPWFALLGLGLLLFSIGVNLFLTWVTWEARSQYRALARRLRGNQYHVEPLS